jgi:hypothetical protein
VISDREFDNLPRSERAAIMQDYARTIGRDVSAHEAGLLADRHAAARLAERESQAAAAHQGFATSGGGLRAYQMTPPWEMADSGPRMPPGRDAQLEAG